MENKCKFCGKEQKRPLSLGYCTSCYQYFILHNYSSWYPSQYGSLSRVQKEDSVQYGWPVCHICGKAFTKLQQHIWYAHKMTKNEYCDKYGLDHSIKMTSNEYSEVMHNHALNNNMDEQLKRAGVNTRFQKGHNNNYERSYQTKQRLCERGKTDLQSYSKKLKAKRQEAIDYIKSFDEVVQQQFLHVLNSPINELNVDQIRLKCALLGYDLDRKVKLE